ncbi:ASCH domain-containing protein [Pseudomonas sp. PSE14]|uniref:ASCH domain-containing protein n=1 Tax=Pseudomonas sp. PSE14 TaxID=3016341 RepID=UPI0023D86665|nr:ASCH domain-containing protein [Pseudomonas sp. PSE14]WEJ74635.1 ASCH domain-containing protein [Pseudomonas sp. PSE14]
MNDAIISIKPQHVENILSGRKTVELRVRGMNLPEGSTLWIYSTLPVGKIKISTEIDFIEVLPPKEIWKKYGKNICISKEEFDDYTKTREAVAAIGLRNIKPLEKDICLETMRAYEKNFQPPQFFSRVNPDRALYSALYKES